MADKSSECQSTAVVSEEFRLYSLSDLPDVLERTGRVRRSYRTLKRWADEGWPDGRKLKCKPVERTLHTCLAWFDALIHGEPVAV